ncbi:MAG: acetyl-CoA C-acetyltransferase, partial [Gammaproteobacteria bacterium]|nr:acetyl-CoA C-acetyltransferase [Gammaproteobacteria bacterium]
MRNVYIVDGTRTPFLKAKGRPGEFFGSDLAVQAGKQLLLKLNISPNLIEEVVIGCAMPGPDEANIARVIGLRLGLPETTMGWTVMRNCASGLQAIDSAYKDIAIGRHDIVLAGGTDSMSHTPLLFNDNMVNWFARVNSQRGFTDKLAAFLSFRPSFLKPVIALERGLTDPIVNMNMGQTAEEVAFRFKISRAEMDAYAVSSHMRLANAIDNNFLTEVAPLYSSSGKIYKFDDGLRRDSNAEKLGTLKPFFDKKYGDVTPANSSQITDGAALLLLASEDAVKKHNLNVLAKIKDVNWAALDPKVMGLGPVYASTPLLTRNNLSLEEVDYWEINEAFAAQVLGCVAAWQDSEFCITALNLPNALGKINSEKLNSNGGAISIGHPIGASGARIT